MRFLAQRLAMMFGAASVLCGCDRGLAACEQAIKASLARPESYSRVSAVEEPGETTAMTYYRIVYRAADEKSVTRDQRSLCSYMRDTGEATPRPE